MVTTRLVPLFLATLLPLGLLVGCGDDDDDLKGSPGAGGSRAGASGTSGQSGAGGAGGSAGGAAGVGGANTSGTAGAAGAPVVKGDLCSAPVTAPSKGACYPVPAGGCNPVTNEGCPQGQTCDIGGESGFTCYPLKGDEAALCKPCENNTCQGTLGCNSDSVCARYCCDDGDCGDATCVKTDSDKPGLCAAVQCKSDSECPAGATCADGKCAVKSDCCTASDLPGCTDTKIQQCVCADDNLCCTESWDSQCVASVTQLGCGKVCPGTCATKADCTDPAKPVCEPASNLCVAPECTSDADCADSFGPVCFENLCVECTKNTDCPADSPVCEANGCVECTKNADCAAQPYAKVCNPDSFTCVLPPCATKADCKDPAYPVCDAANKECVECLADSDCKDPSKPTCTEGACEAQAEGLACDAPAVAKSDGACYKAPSGGCNPVNNAGCKADEVCDVGGSGFQCYGAGDDDAVLCESCEEVPCAKGLSCSPSGQCARYCCDDGDCGANGVCDKTTFDGVVGICLAK